MQLDQLYKNIAQYIQYREIAFGFTLAWNSERSRQ